MPLNFPIITKSNNKPPKGPLWSHKCQNCLFGLIKSKDFTLIHICDREILSFTSHIYPYILYSTLPRPTVSLHKIMRPFADTTDVHWG